MNDILVTKMATIVFIIRGTLSFLAERNPTEFNFESEHMLTIQIIPAPVDIIICLPLRCYLERLYEYYSNDHDDQQNWSNYTTKSNICVVNETSEMDIVEK